jgi:ribose 1,5-bisphosphokinase
MVFSRFDTVTEMASVVGNETEKLGPGALVLVVGPSGAGKDTLIARARARLAADFFASFPTRLITRAPDTTEQSAALDEPEFERLIAGGGAALFWRAHGLGYAVPVEINRTIAAGGVVVVNVSRAIIPEALARYERVTVVLVTAPIDVLAKRLAGRGRESAEDIAARLRRAEGHLPAAPSLVVIQNVGDPEEGAMRLEDVVRDLHAARALRAFG